MSRTIAYAFALFFLTASAAFAANAGGGGTMPWDAPLTAIQQDLSGVTATSISLIAIVVVFGVLIFGGELNHFARTLCFIVMAAAVLVAGNGVLAAMNIAGAEVDSAFGYDLYGFCSGALAASLIWAFGIRLRGRWRRRQLIRETPATGG
jgi:type IV secretion system protein VirB2